MARAAATQPDADPIYHLVEKINDWNFRWTDIEALFFSSLKDVPYSETGEAWRRIKVLDANWKRLLDLTEEIFLLHLKDGDPKKLHTLILRIPVLMGIMSQRAKEVESEIARLTTAANIEREKLPQVGMNVTKFALDIAPYLAAGVVLLKTRNEQAATVTKNVFIVAEHGISDLVNAQIHGQQDVVDQAYGGSFADVVVEGAVDVIAEVIAHGNKIEKLKYKGALLNFLVKPALSAAGAAAQAGTETQEERGKKVKEAVEKSFAEGLNKMLHDKELSKHGEITKEAVAPILAAVLGGVRALLDHKPIKDGVLDGLNDYVKQRAQDGVAGKGHGAKEGSSDSHGHGHADGHGDGAHQAGSHGSAAGHNGGGAAPARTNGRTSPKPEPQHHHWNEAALGLTTAAKVRPAPVPR